MGDNIKQSLETKVKEIFKTMDYGEVFENVNEALGWLKANEEFSGSLEKQTGQEECDINCAFNNQILCKVLIPNSDLIEKVLENASNNKFHFHETKGIERMALINKFAEEIIRNTEFIVQLEICIRGILSQDTKKNISLLTEYLEYYSSFCLSLHKQKPNWKPKGMSAVIFNDQNALSLFGIILAPILAAGYNIIIFAEKKMSILISFLLKLSQKVGFPEGVIKLIPYKSQIKINQKISTITFFDYPELDYETVKKTFYVEPRKAPCLIFDSADVDSASEAVINLAWNNQGSDLSSIDTILIQENIFSKVLRKIKQKLDNCKVDFANKKADLSPPSDEIISSNNSVIAEAKKLGFEVYESGKEKFKPSLVIGGKVQTNVIKNDRTNTVLTVLQFRTVDEAVALANNSKQGCFAFVWSENISLVNEVSKKLKVSNVYINASSGLFSASIGFNSFKKAGTGYFGGTEGFWQYIHETESVPLKKIESKSDLNAYIAATKKAQESWAKISNLNRAKLFKKLSLSIESDKKKFGVSEKVLEDVLEGLEEILGRRDGSFCTSLMSFSVSSFREARGLITVELGEIEDGKVRTVFAGLYEGNGIILITSSAITEKFFSEVAKVFPSGLINIVPYSEKNIEGLLSHREISGYFGSKFLMYQKEAFFVNKVSDSWEDAYRNVVVVKNIWSNIGATSQCSL